MKNLQGEGSAAMSSAMKRQKFGALDAVVVDRLRDADHTPKRVVVLLHGYGAPGTDLVGLATELNPQQSTRFVFLQAPHSLPGPGGASFGRAWWDIDMVQLQVILMTRSFDTLANSHPPGLDEATVQLQAALVEIEASSAVKPEATYVGGFSQGAMLTCNWALSSERPVAGLILLSGTVLRQAQWENALRHRSTLRVFQSHSPDDQVLPFELGTRLKSMFETAGVEHTWVSFRGGHGIGPEVLGKLQQFLT